MTAVAAGQQQDFSNRTPNHRADDRFSLSLSLSLALSFFPAVPNVYRVTSRVFRLQPRGMKWLPVINHLVKKLAAAGLNTRAKDEQPRVSFCILHRLKLAKARCTLTKCTSVSVEVLSRDRGGAILSILIALSDSSKRFECNEAERRFEIVWNSNGDISFNGTIV